MMIRVLSLFLLMVGFCFAEDGVPDRKLLGKSEVASFKDKVVVVTVGEHDLMNKKSFAYWRKVMRRVDEEGARAMVFELDTPGGLAFDTAEIITKEMRQMKTRTIAFVNPNAISAGALISIGTEAIYMAPGAVIGSAAVVSGDGATMDPKMRAKVEALLGAYVRSTVKDRGHRLDIVEAMMFVDDEADREFAGVSVKKGGLLTLTAEEAAQVVDGKPVLAQGVVTDLEELLLMEGMAGTEIVRAEPSGFEKLAWWVGLASPVLILVGLGGGYLELKSPGFGVGGVISLVAFSLFFFGNYVAGNLAGYELAAVFVLGLVLIVVEVFVLPGLIVPGVLGLAMVVGAMFFAMVDEFAIEDFRSTDFSGESVGEFFGGAMWRLALGFLGSLVLLGVMMRFLPNLPFFNRMVLAEEQAGAGVSADALSEEDTDIMGLEGVAETDLRPAGKMRAGSESYDVTAGEGFIEKGAAVRVVKVRLMRIVVERV